MSLGFQVMQHARALGSPVNTSCLMSGIYTRPAVEDSETPAWNLAAYASCLTTDMKPWPLLAARAASIFSEGGPPAWFSTFFTETYLGDYEGVSLFGRRARPGHVNTPTLGVVLGHLQQESLSVTAEKPIRQGRAEISVRQKPLRRGGRPQRLRKLDARVLPCSRWEQMRKGLAACRVRTQQKRAKTPFTFGLQPGDQEMETFRRRSEFSSITFPRQILYVSSGGSGQDIRELIAWCARAGSWFGTCIRVSKTVRSPTQLYRNLKESALNADTTVGWV